MTEYQRERVVIENIRPCIDCGRFPIKRVIGRSVMVTADVFADGHEELSVVLRYRTRGRRQWSSTTMRSLGNDRWQAPFTVDEVGEYLYTVSAWVDDFRTWQKKLVKRVEANQDIAVDLLIGADLLERAASRVEDEDSAALRDLAAQIRNAGTQAEAAALATDARARELARLCPEHAHATTFSPALRVVVDRERAGFSAWYEMFPRSCSPAPGRHGTFKDCEARLPYIASLGFDVLYLPPIHPIGITARKGRNNAVVSEEGDPGTPWAIGSAAGGHKAVHPELGTLDDFRSLVAKAREHGMEVALDIAFQCSPDHPYVREHPGWFRWRPDGTVQYAENPPKKYQDIYPLEFDSDDSKSLWDELRSILQHWIDQGIRIFRVDNPHTKPFAFWEWLITSLRQEHPDLIFLAEAFTRPKVMARLAKLGFTQSYTYFTWRRSKWELIEYITELTRTDLSEYYRPNFWPNTPDILMDYLQEGGRAAFEARFVLAATLSSNYGVYGPAFELCVNTPRDPGSEEYLNSEKYELKHWNLDAPASIRDLITRVNRVRKESRALQQTNSVRVEHVDNDTLIAYSKWDTETSDWLLMVVSLDAKRDQTGWITLDLGHTGAHEAAAYEVTDLLTGARFNWTGARNFVSLGPTTKMAHIFRVGLPYPSQEPDPSR
jgi:starch synthase (maltosyl-transferring)